MRRFIVLTIFGGLATLAGHALISFGLHPERLAPVAVLLQGSAILVVGTALFGTGLLGLADGYEKLALRVDELLRQKELTEIGDGFPVRDQDGLHCTGRKFWSGYGRAGAGLSIFLAGLLAVTATLTRLSPSLFSIGVGCATIILAFVTMSLTVHGLRRLRSAHVGGDSSARRLSRIPDRRQEERVPTTRRRRPTRVTLFPRRGANALSRGLERSLSSDQSPSIQPG